MLTYVRKRYTALGRVSSNLLVAGVAGGFARLVSLISTAYMARTLGLDAYGKLAFAESIAGFGMLISDVGLQTIGLREIAKRNNDPASYKRLVDAILTIQFITSATLFAVITTIGWLFVPGDSLTKWLITLYAFCLLFPYVPTIEWWLNGIERLSLTALLRLAREVLFLVLLVVFVHGIADAIRVPMAQGVAMLAAAGVIIWNYGRVARQAISPLFDKAFWLSLLRMSWPIGLAGVVNHFALRVGVLMLGSMTTDQQVSLYSASWKLYLIGAEVNSLIALAVFPALARTFAHDRVAFRNTLRKYQVFMIALGLVTCVAGFLIAPLIVQIVFGAAFEASVVSLRIFMVALGVLLMGAPRGVALLAARYEKCSLFIGIVSMTIQVFGGFLLIGPLQAVGASIGFALSVTVATCMSLWLYQRKVARDTNQLFLNS